MANGCGEACRVRDCQGQKQLLRQFSALNPRLRNLLVERAVNNLGKSLKTRELIGIARPDGWRENGNLADFTISAVYESRAFSRSGSVGS